MTWSPSWTGQPPSSVSCDGDPGDAHDRRLPAQELLDGVRDELGVLDELAPLLGVLGQEGEHAVERGRDRVEPGDEEEEADVEDVLAAEPVALDLGVEEVREQVVLPLVLTLVEDLVEVVVDRVGDLLLVVAGLLRPVELPGHVVRADDPVLHGEEAVELVERQAEQGEEDLGGERDGELLGEVHLAPVDEAVDEVVDERGDLVVHERHLARGEDRVEQLAELLVLRRVDLERDHRPLVLEVDRVHVGREDLGMAQRLRDLLLAREEDARARRHVDGITGISSRSTLKMGCGLAAISGSMPDSGLCPVTGLGGYVSRVTHWSSPLLRSAGCG